MEKSTHRCEVVEVKLETHPNADSLSIVTIWGYKCVVRTDDWKDKQLGVYIPPDSVVPTEKPEFVFLGKHNRIKARKFRGVMSFGLLVPAPSEANLGEDYAHYYGITHYEPELAIASKGRNSYMSGGEVASPPKGIVHSKYDIDNLMRYPNVIQEGELVVVREKIHGANSRFVCVDGEMHCGSRTEWKKEYANKPEVSRERLISHGVPEDKIEEILKKVEEKLANWTPKQNMWWRILQLYPQVKDFCSYFPGHVLFGETFGQVQDLKYGTQPEEVRFVAFDILSPDGIWLDAEELDSTLTTWTIPQPPRLSLIGIPYNFDEICKLSDGPSLIAGANHLREGCVVRTVKERWDDSIGRCQLKVVSGEFLEKH